MPEWALRLLIGTLLIPVAAVLLDGLARARRRRQPFARWVAWTLTCALPFLACALFAILLGALGAIAATPSDSPGRRARCRSTATRPRRCSRARPCSGSPGSAWPALVRRLGLARCAPRPRPPGSTPPGSRRCSCCWSLACVVWLFNPYAALLIVPGLHLLLPIASPERRPRPLAGLALLALALVPLGLLVAFYAHQLGYGPGGLAAGPRRCCLPVGTSECSRRRSGASLSAAPWRSALVALTPPADPLGLGAQEHPQVTIRGPLSYAGPGSLGGTESALRR